MNRVRVQHCASLLTVVALISLQISADAAAVPNRPRVTTVSSREDTTQANLDTATSISQPLSDYLQSIAWWSLANLSLDALNTSTRNHVDRLFGETKTVFMREQRKLLVKENGRYKPLVFAIATAAMMTRAQCRRQFQNERWDCADTGHVQRGRYRTTPYYQKLISYTTRQTAFLTALSSAALMSSVVHMCRRGLNNFPCECDPRYRSGAMPLSQIPDDVRANTLTPNAQAAKTYEWGGCSDNVDFGKKFVKQFTRKPDSGNDQRFIANKHNREAGIVVLERNIETKCQCHGVSGSCQSRVCFRRHNQFDRIAEQLKRMYDVAKRVVLNAYSSHQPTLLYQGGKKTPNATELVYTDETRDDDFCNDNPVYGTPSTQRRTCQADSKGVNYKETCEYLCCGRGYSSKLADKQLPDHIVFQLNNQPKVIAGKFVKYTRYECY